MNTLEIAHRWADVQSTQGYNYFYPGPVSPEMKKQYRGPAVYSWMVWTPGDRIYSDYVGETNDFAGRIQQYPWPRQAAGNEPTPEDVFRSGGKSRQAR